jgi:hypothetical protein
MKTAKLTQNQIEALEVLKRMDTLPRTEHGNINTGLHLNIIRGLRRKGILTVEHIYGGGHISPDATLNLAE